MSSGGDPLGLTLIQDLFQALGFSTNLEAGVVGLGGELGRGTEASDELLCGSVRGEGVGKKS